MGAAAQAKAKILLPLDDEHCALSLSLAALRQSDVLRGLVLAVRPEDRADIEPLAERECAGLNVLIVCGGASRQESVRAGLHALEGRAEFVLVHDAARPFCPPAQVRRVAEAGRESGAALLAVRAKSTLKKVNQQNIIEQTVPRAGIWEAQTPQVFSYSLLCRAHEAAERDGYTGTDDCELVERLGRPVKVIEGSELNMKLTTAQDLELARALLGCGRRAVS